MQPHEEVLEFRRKTFHLVCGTVIAALLWLGVVDGYFLAAVSFFLLGFFLLVREDQVRWPLFHAFLHLFEREQHLKTAPGKSAIYFLFGSAAVALLFPLDIAVASILILAFGDAVSCLVGHHFGTVTTPLHPKKAVEGPIVAIIISSVVASLFVPFWMAAIAASVAMVLEMPRWTVLGWHVDDNLIIPISSAIVFSLLGA